MTPRVTDGHNRTARTTCLYFSECFAGGWRGRMGVDRGRPVAPSGHAIRPAPQGGAPRRARRLPARTTRGRRGRHPLRRGAGPAPRRHPHHAARRRLARRLPAGPRRLRDGQGAARRRRVRDRRHRRDAGAGAGPLLPGVRAGRPRRRATPDPARAVLLRPGARSCRARRGVGAARRRARASYPSASATTSASPPASSPRSASSASATAGSRGSPPVRCTPRGRRAGTPTWSTTAGWRPTG